MPTYNGQYSMADHLRQLGVKTWITTSWEAGARGIRGSADVVRVDLDGPSVLRKLHSFSGANPERVGYAQSYARHEATVIAADPSVGGRVALTLYSDRTYRIVKVRVVERKVGRKTEKLNLLGFDLTAEAAASQFIEESYEAERDGRGAPRRALR